MGQRRRRKRYVRIAESSGCVREGRSGDRRVRRRGRGLGGGGRGMLIRRWEAGWCLVLRMPFVFCCCLKGVYELLSMFLDFW